MTRMLTRRDAMRLPGALIAVAGLSGAWRPARAAGGEAVGKVAAVVGQSFTEAQGKRTALKPGDDVAVGKPIDVPAGAKLQMRMRDGTTLAVASETHMTITECETDAAGQRQDTKISLAQGLVRATVAPAGPQSVFQVASASGTAAANGADCFIEAKPDGLQVGVLAGSAVIACVGSARAETIPARWGARVEAGRDPVPPRVWSPAEFAAVTARTNVS
jgi:hypothetical protein